MFIGHAGLVAALRSLSDKPSGTLALIALILAGYAPDIMDTAFYFAGFCSPYGLYSHTIPSVIIQASVIGGAAWLVSGSRGITILFIVTVVSHVPADFLTGHKLVWPGAGMMGKGWYDRPILDALLEFPLVVVGWWVLRRSAKGPAWSRTVLVLVTALVPQLAFDAYHYAFQVTLKPSTCFDESFTFKLRSSN